MADLSWALYIVANHSRREILVEAGPVAPESAPPTVEDEENGPPTLVSRVERRLFGTPLVAEWDTFEDRIALIDAVPVGSRDTAVSRARLARDNPVGLLCRNRRARELVAKGYDVLGGAEGVALESGIS